MFRKIVRQGKAGRISSAALATGMLALAVTADANVVTFDPIAGGPWGAAHGNVPGDHIFTEDDVHVGVEEFKIGAFTGFIEARIAAATPDFGSGRILSVNNINVTFKFTDVPDAPCAVQFDYFDQGGLENLRVNGGVLFEDDLPDLNGVVVAPGVTCWVSTIPTPSGVAGRVFLDGPVTDCWVGGQEFFLEDVRTVCAADKDCDHVVDHETLPMGSMFGACNAQLPGELAFVEDGIPVFLTEFVLGGSFFNCATVDPPFPYYGKSHIMNLNNIGLVYDFSALPCQVGRVSFNFLDLGGEENFSVNGAPLYVGNLAAAPGAWPPDVTLNVVTDPVPGGVRGQGLLEGTIDRMRLGGQEFWVDNVCAECLDPVAVPGTGGQSIARLAPLPNPYRAGASISFSLATATQVELSVFDVRGSRVAVLASRAFGEGEHTVSWDGRGDDGSALAPGAYFVRMAHELGVSVSKIVLVR